MHQSKLKHKKGQEVVQQKNVSGAIALEDNRSNSSFSGSALQLMSKSDLVVYQESFVRQHSGSKGWDLEKLDDLIEWASSYKQIQNILGKMSYEEWSDIRHVHVDGSELANKVVKPDILFDPDLDPKGQKPDVERLRKYADYWAKMANPVSPNQSLKSLIDNQRKYETVIAAVNQKDGTSALDTHRTLGIELEFAQYGGASLGSHVDLAVSNDSVLKTVPGIWVLETDSNKKLEVGVPPMYVIDADSGKLNIKVVSAVRAIVKKALETARDKFKDGSLVKDFLSEMPNQGLGKNWSKKAALSDGLRFEGRKKHDPVWGHLIEQSDKLGLHDSKEQNKYMYEQINVAMTGDEIAQDISSQTEHEKTLPKRSYDWLGTLAGEILAYLDSKMKDKGLASAKILMSKGLAGIGALPDIIDSNGTGVASYVKEIFGIWVKDNTPNQVVSAAMSSKNGIEQLAAFTNDGKKKGKPKRATQNANAISDMILRGYAKSRQGQFDDDPPEVEEGEQKAIKREVKATLLSINNLIPASHWLATPQTKFGSEKFDGQNSGLGVRKDTFVSIPSGDKRKLHLAEIRSDWTIDKFTQDHTEE